MAFFKKGENIEKREELEKPYIPTITETGTVVQAIQEIKNFQLVPVADILTGSLELSERLEQMGKEIMRTDFILVPKRAITKMSNNRIGFDTSAVERFDNLIEFFHMHIFDSEYLNKLGGRLDVKRIATTDGWEIYTAEGTEMLEIQSEVCRRCHTCHEQRPMHWHSEIIFGENRHHWVTIRDLRTYVIHQPLLNILYKTGIHIVEVKHPCEVRSLFQIMRISDDVGADPPEMRIVFPVQQE